MEKGLFIRSLIFAKEVSLFHLIMLPLLPSSTCDLHGFFYIGVYKTVMRVYNSTPASYLPKPVTYTQQQVILKGFCEGHCEEIGVLSSFAQVGRGTMLVSTQRTRLAIKNKVPGEPYRARNHQRHLPVFRVLQATAQEAGAYRIAPSNVQETCSLKD